MAQPEQLDGMVRRDTILWTRTPESATQADAWLKKFAPQAYLHVAPLQRYRQRPLPEMVAQWPTEPATWHVALTSLNGVQAALACLDAVPHADSWRQEVPWWAVGPGTATALRNAGIARVHVATPPDVHGLVSHLIQQSVERVVSVCASNARPVLRIDLSAAGCQVREIVAYDPEPVAVDFTKVWSRVACVPLGSAATVERFLNVLSEQQHQDLHAGTPRLIAMGKHTATAIQASGLPLFAAAAEPSVPALLTACLAALPNTSHHG
jgi:uroporphyrinogen-III synthase